MPIVTAVGVAELAGRTESLAIVGAAYERYTAAPAYTDVWGKVSAPGYTEPFLLDLSTSTEAIVKVTNEDYEALLSQVPAVKKMLGRLSITHVDDSVIESALKTSLMKLNELPPVITRFRPKDMLRYSQCWQFGALTEIFIKLAQIEARNYVSPQTATTVTRQNKFQEYMDLWQRFNEQFVNLATNIKHQNNLLNNFGWDSNAGWSWWW